MKWLISYRMRIVFVGIVAVNVLGGGIARGDFTFGTPKNLGPPVNSVASEYSHCVSADGLELYLSSNRKGGTGNYSYDIWVSTRSKVDVEWGPPENMGPLINSSSTSDIGPALSSDDLELYFQSSRPGGMGSEDIWVTRRTTRDDSWGQPENLGSPVNTSDAEYNPSLSSDGLELYFAFSPAGDEWEPQLAVSTRETKDAPWGVPVILGPVINNWPYQDTPWISSDGLVLMFTDYGWGGSPRPGGLGSTDIWFSRRATKESDWGEPVNLGSAINTSCAEDFPMISADGSTLYFSSKRFCGEGNYDLWQAPILPVVDFDDDGIVAINDLLTLIESWGTDDPQCDIGPMAWGDGVVNEVDLEVLMKYWGQDFNAPPEPMAHWKLDESEGTTAYDSAGTNDANLVGDPLWQPAGGWLDGALELDGVDDGAEAGFVLDPRDNPISVFAWVKGGGPGQVIISQAKGEFGRGINWLLTDSVGNLKSEFIWLNYGVWDPGPDLFSSAQITDGQWHHVGLVWYSFGTRILYVDGIEVAKDTVQEGSFIHDEDGGINIGFRASILHLPFPGVWSGLIDDVRIYDKALTPEEIAELAQ